VLAYFVAAMSPNMDVANAALPVYVSTLLYFGGGFRVLVRWDPNDVLLRHAHGSLGGKVAAITTDEC
jgi:hypothetical protein